MKTKETITFAFLGDLMIGGEFVPYAEERGKDFLSPFTTIEPYLADADILFVNLEGPIFEGLNKRPGVTSILSNHPSVLDLCARASVCVVNLSNNHIMDYNSEGLNKTIEVLNRRGIHHVGAGENREEAERTLIIECKDKRIAFIACTSDEPFVGSVLATRERPGCASFLELERVTDRIKRLKSDVDIICVSLHWGHEYYFYPSYAQMKIAHSLGEAGAHLIIGHHPHVIQGLESHKGTLITYSLGNCFLPSVRTTGGRLEPRKAVTKEFMVLKATIGYAGLTSLDSLGGRVERDFTLKPYDEPSQIKFIARLEELSKPLCSADYDDFWQKYRLRRDKELEREALLEALKKLAKTPPRKLAKTVTFADVRRNVLRFCRVISKSVVSLRLINWKKSR